MLLNVYFVCISLRYHNCMQGYSSNPKWSASYARTLHKRRGAYAAHKAILASGRKLMEEARASSLVTRKRRKLERDARKQAEQRARDTSNTSHTPNQAHSANVDGI